MALKLQLGKPSFVPDARLEGLRVYMRPPHDRDWHTWAHLRESSRRFLAPWEPEWPADALTRDSFRRRLRRYAENWRADLGYSLFILRQSDGMLIGGVSVTNLRRGIVQSASLGYWIGEAHAGRGYMTEALRALMPFCFEHLALHRLEAACLPHNGASRAVLKKLGFQEEGLARQYLCIAGVWQDHLTFGLLQQDWRGAVTAGTGGSPTTAGAQANAQARASGGERPRLAFTDALRAVNTGAPPPPRLDRKV